MSEEFDIEVGNGMQNYLKSKKHIIEVNKTLLRNQEYQQELVNEYLKNKDNSLEDRWEVWTKYSQQVDEKYCYHSFPEDRFPGLTDEIISDRNRHEVIEYPTFLDSCLVTIAKELFPDKRYYSLTKEEELEVESHPRNKDLMEYIMEQNLGSFELDW